MSFLQGVGRILRLFPWSCFCKIDKNVRYFNHKCLRFLCLSTLVSPLYSPCTKYHWNDKRHWNDQIFQNEDLAKELLSREHIQFEFNRPNLKSSKSKKKKKVQSYFYQELGCQLSRYKNGLQVHSYHPLWQGHSDISMSCDAWNQKCAKDGSKKV